MRKNAHVLTVLAVLASLWGAKASFDYPSGAGTHSEEALRKTAEHFVNVVDTNDAEALKKLLHPQLTQYVQLGGKLIPFAAADFIQMVADKKIGGTPRKISFRSSAIVRGKTANVILNAVSHEYDFMYQLSMVESDGNWLIVGITVDIQKV